MAILARLKKIRVNEDEDEEIDDADEDDEDDDDLNGGGLAGKLGKLRGLGKMGSAGGLLGKVMKRGGNEDDDDDEDDDEDLSSVSVAPVAALDLSENSGGEDIAVEPGPEAGLVAAESVVSLTEVPVEITVDSVPAEEAKADDLELGDMFEEKLEIDPILRDLALSQDDTAAGQLLDELTLLLSQLEKMVSN